MNIASIAAQLREEARSFEHDREVFAGQALADYLESTTESRYGERAQREIYAEIAMAFVAGYEERNDGRARDLQRAIRDAGLTL